MNDRDKLIDLLNEIEDQAFRGASGDGGPFTFGNIRRLAVAALEILEPSDEED